MITEDEFKKKFPMLTKHYVNVKCVDCGRLSQHIDNIVQHCLDKSVIADAINSILSIDEIDVKRQLKEKLNIEGIKVCVTKT